MTNDELIEWLAKFPKGTRVVLDGYEGDAEEIASVEPARILPDANMVPQMFGKHPDTVPAECGMGRHRFSDAGEPVVYIKRQDWNNRPDDT